MEKKLKTNSRDKATKKRIHEHLSDQNDIISDEDILNAKTDLSNDDDNSEINSSQNNYKASIEN